MGYVTRRGVFRSCLFQVHKSNFTAPFAINAASARSHGGAGLSPLGLASTAALSPSNDLVKNYPGAPDSVVELHTGPVCNTWHASV